MKPINIGDMKKETEGIVREMVLQKEIEAISKF